MFKTASKFTVNGEGEVWVTGRILSPRTAQYSAAAVVVGVFWTGADLVDVDIE